MGEDETTTWMQDDPIYVYMINHIDYLTEMEQCCDFIWTSIKYFIYLVTCLDVFNDV